MIRNVMLAVGLAAVVALAPAAASAHAGHDHGKKTKKVKKPKAKQSAVEWRVSAYLCGPDAKA